jgi:hypothetical protein
MFWSTITVVFLTCLVPNIRLRVDVRTERMWPPTYQLGVALLNLADHAGNG